jgi:xanthine dehydrogenase accessory factor
MLVTSDARTYGTVGGGAIELKIIDLAKEVMQNNKAIKQRFDLENELEMHCGGFVEVYIEAIAPLRELYIFGAGHVGFALAQLAHDFGFNVCLVDNRKDLIEAGQAKGFRCLEGDFVEEARKLQTTPNTYLVVTTPKHQYDEDVTGLLAAKDSKYLGMIGSKKKVALARKHFTEQKLLNPEQIERIDMPIGIPFNAQTPNEIAVSILAKLIDVKNG